jgi:hypothetical protein
MMKICSLDRCPVKDQYIKEHCFYGYSEPKCWRGWLIAFWNVIKLRVKR